MSRKGTCQTCGEGLNEGQIVYCKECHAPFHQQCFEFTGNCSIHGCNGQEWVELLPELPVPSMEEGIVVVEKNIPLEKTDPIPVPLRFLGSFIDYIILFICGMMLNVLLAAMVHMFGGGSLAYVMQTILSQTFTMFYLLTRDGMLGTGQSIGKFFVGYKVVGPQGENCTMAQSIKRNIIFVVPNILGILGALFFLIPAYGPMASIIIQPIALLGWLALVGIETGALMVDKEGRRIGDHYAGTHLRSRSWKPLQLPPTQRMKELT